MTSSTGQGRCCKGLFKDAQALLTSSSKQGLGEGVKGVIRTQAQGEKEGPGAQGWAQKFTRICHFLSTQTCCLQGKLGTQPGACGSSYWQAIYAGPRNADMTLLNTVSNLGGN